MKYMCPPDSIFHFFFLEFLLGVDVPGCGFQFARDEERRVHGRRSYRLAAGAAAHADREPRREEDHWGDV